jgi:hypothetical protein
MNHKPLLIVVTVLALMVACKKESEIFTIDPSTGQETLLYTLTDTLGTYLDDLTVECHYKASRLCRTEQGYR